ncbi:unnamed protein product [Ascophyllum nodosum]
MSASGAVSARSFQRSNSSSKGSRRSTLAIGPGGVLPGLRSGSLSPERALRTRVLRGKINDGSGNHSATNDANSDGKAKFSAKAVASKGATISQHMQFAFGSKVIKPGYSKSGMTTAAGESRVRAIAVANNADTGNHVHRPRRERSTRRDVLEQPRALRRGPATTSAQQQSPMPQKELKDCASLQAKLDDRDETIADLRRQLEKTGAADGQGVHGRSNELGTSAAESAKMMDGDEAALDEGARAALKAVEEESRAELETTLVQVGAVTSAELSRTEEMQARVDKIIRMLKARRN